MSPLLSVKNLGISFGGVRAVDGVTFDVARGEVFTLIGPNGAGKTTVFNLISRLYTPSSGTIELDGTDLGRRAPHEIAGLGIARTFQNIELFEPHGLYGRWLKLRTYLQIFPFYRRGMFQRQKSYLKSDRLR